MFVEVIAPSILGWRGALSKGPSLPENTRISMSMTVPPVTNLWWRLHEDAELQRIDAAAVHLLERTGCRVEHDGLLRQLEATGCHVDWAARRARIPGKLIREVLAHVSLAGKPEVSLPRGWNPSRRLSQTGSFPHLLDWPSGERRLATKEDVITIAKMGHVLPEVETVGRALTCVEVPPAIEPLWTTLALARTTDKPIGGGEVFFAHYIEPLVRMGEALSGRTGDTSLVAACDFFIAPLTMERSQAQCFVEKRRLGLQNVPGTMPISGISGPVTIAGTVVIAVAELLAGWVLGYVVAPELLVGGIVATGSLDMRSTATLFGSPEAVLQDLTTVQVCKRLYGIPVWAATSYTDCKVPGLNAVWQKMYPLVGAAFGTGLALGGDGLLSAGQDYSPVQQLLELEINQSLDRFWGGFEITDDTLAIELTAEMIERGVTNYLDTDHTNRHYRKEQWYPRWLDRTQWQGLPFEVESEAQMLARIDEYWKSAVARYRPPERDARQLAELERIYELARTERRAEVNL
jgi:trimethylamine--corrinoid protein Co-methyltransferase